MTGEPLAMPMAIATGVFIDSDHIIEYADWLLQGGRRFMIVPFHAWEYSTIGIILLFSVWYHPLLLAAVLGHLFHLVCDQFANRVYPLSYFISYRVAQRFRYDRLIRPPEFMGARAERPLWSYVEPWIWRRVYRRRLQSQTQTGLTPQPATEPGND